MNPERLGWVSQSVNDSSNLSDWQSGTGLVAGRDAFSFQVFRHPDRKTVSQSVHQSDSPSVSKASCQSFHRDALVQAGDGVGSRGVSPSPASSQVIPPCARLSVSQSDCLSLRQTVAVRADGGAVRGECRPRRPLPLHVPICQSNSQAVCQLIGLLLCNRVVGRGKCCPRPPLPLRYLLVLVCQSIRLSDSQTLNQTVAMRGPVVPGRKACRPPPPLLHLLVCLSFSQRVCRQVELLLCRRAVVPGDRDCPLAPLPSFACQSVSQTVCQQVGLMMRKRKVVSHCGEGRPLPHLPQRYLPGACCPRGLLLKKKPCSTVSRTRGS